MRMIPGAMVCLIWAGGALGAAEPVVGRWLWIEKQTLTFGSDGGVVATKAGQPVMNGKWAVKDSATRKYSIQWVKGAVEEVEVSSDGWTLIGKTDEGVPKRGEKLDDGEPGK